MCNEKEQPTYRLSAVFGSVQLVNDHKVEDGRIWLGGHAIHRDIKGNIVKVTETTWNVSMKF